MNTKNALAIISDHFISVEVKFAGSSKKYTYLAEDSKIEVDDLVIVSKAPELDRLLLGHTNVALVTGVQKPADIDPNFDYEYNWIVGKVDASRFFELHQLKNKLASELDSQRRTLRRKEILQNLTGSRSLLASAEKLLQDSGVKVLEHSEDLDEE